MTNIRVVGWVLLCAVLAVAACDGKAKHNKFRKGLGKDDGRVTSEWAKVVTSSDANGCLRVVELAKLIAKADTELISIHTADLEFVTVEEKITKTAPAPAPTLTLTEAQRKAGVKLAVPVSTTNTRYTFPRVDGEFEILKLNYFFKGDSIPVAETIPGKDVFKSSEQLFGLLNAEEQIGCESVTFRTAKGPQKFTVIEGGRNSIKLSSAAKFVPT